MQEEIEKLEKEYSASFYDNIRIEERINYLKRNLDHGNIQKTNDTSGREHNEMEKF